MSRVVPLLQKTAGVIALLLAGLGGVSLVLVWLHSFTRPGYGRRIVCENAAECEQIAAAQREVVLMLVPIIVATVVIGMIAGKWYRQRTENGGEEA